MVGRSFADFICAGHYDVFTFPKRLVNSFFSFDFYLPRLVPRDCLPGLLCPRQCIFLLSCQSVRRHILFFIHRVMVRTKWHILLIWMDISECYVISLNAMDSSRLWLISLIYELIEKWLLSSHAKRISHGIMVLLNGVLCTLKKSTSQGRSLSSSLKCGLHHPVGHWPMLLLQALMSQLSQFIETLTDADGEIPVFSGSRV